MPGSAPATTAWPPGRWPRWVWGVLLAVVLVGVGVAVWFLRPVVGPPRDLTLTADADHGDYLIRLGACISCHTDKAHEGPVLAGGGPLQTRFGTFFAPNITPDKATGIGDWTLREFSDAISNGIGRHGENLYPVFPYPNFTLMSDQDVVDLYAALMRMQPVANTPPANELPFPFSVRLLVSGWKSLYFTPRRFAPDPDQSDAWNRGRFLAVGPGHCIACHSPRNSLEAVEQEKAFEGNPVAGTGGKAPSITGPALLADGFTVETLAAMLKTGVTVNDGKVGDEMGDVIADETSHWTEADRRAVATYLMSLG
jgi:mono/diheme cytochrome c family protein